MTNLAYLPTTLITDKGNAFTSTIFAETTQIVGITLKCATTKHPETIGKLERKHASPKTNLKMACGEYRRIWHKNLPLAVLNHNTSYHESIGCEPTRVFHEFHTISWITSLEIIQTNRSLRRPNLKKKSRIGQNS